MAGVCGASFAFSDSSRCAADTIASKPEASGRGVRTSTVSTFPARPTAANTSSLMRMPSASSMMSLGMWLLVSETPGLRANERLQQTVGHRRV